MIITPFAIDLPALPSRRNTSTRFFYLPGHGMQGCQTPVREWLTPLVAEARKANRSRATRSRVLGLVSFASQSGWRQRVGPAVEVL